MVNSDVDESNTGRDETEHESKTTSGCRNSLTVLKEESFEELSQNKVEVNEDKDEWTPRENKSNINKDTIINVGINETSCTNQRSGRHKVKLWPFRRPLLTRYLWQQRYQRQQRHLQGKQGYIQQKLFQHSQKRQQVMFQHGEDFFRPQEFDRFGMGYDDVYPEPLEYDPKTRNSFVLIVMVMVLVMLIITTAFIAYVLITPDLKAWFVELGMLILLPSMFGLLMANYAMMCSPCARTPPCSYVILFLTTLCMSCMAALISSYYRTEIIFYAAVSTTVIVFVCSILACTHFDFTKWSLFVVVIGTAISVMAIVISISMKFTGIYIKPLHLGILTVSVLVQSVVLVIELQMVLGGKTIELAEDDYALAAFMLYTSIVDVFIKMVQILGLMEDV